MIITLKFLKNCDVCYEGMRFFEVNFPISLFLKGLDISKIEVIGDYKNYFKWIVKKEKYLKSISKRKYFKYDDRGNVIEENYKNGSIYKYEYNCYNNLIIKKHCVGDIYKSEYKYDFHNNCIEEKMNVTINN